MTPHPTPNRTKDAKSADSYEPPKGPAPKTSLPSKQIIRIYTYGPRLSVGPGPYNVRSTKNLADATNRNGEEEKSIAGTHGTLKPGRQDNTSKDDPKCQARNTTNKHCHRHPGHETRPGTWTPRATARAEASPERSASAEKLRFDRRKGWQPFELQISSAAF